MDLAGIRKLRAELSTQCSTLDPDDVALFEVVPLWQELDRIARLASGAKLRLLRRLDDAGVGPASGERSTEEWAAKQAGTTIGTARQALETSRRLAQLPSTDEALAKGELSEQQAAPITDAAALDPDAEQGLLDAAQQQPVRELQETCRRTKANARPDDAARREAIHRARSARTFTDAEGAWNLHVRHLPEVGAEIEALLAPFIHARFTEARTRGDRDPREAYAADALLDLARAAHRDDADVPTGASRVATKLIVHIDIDTLRRGHTEPGSRCDIAGVGPVNVDWVRSILGDAFVALLVEDGEDVRTVCHAGRQVTARQRTALEARGYVCDVPGCGSRCNLQIDHRIGWAITKRTVLDDLGWFCPFHHDQKTHRSYRLEGPPGARVWRPPERRADAA